MALFGRRLPQQNNLKNAVKHFILCDIRLKELQKKICLSKSKCYYKLFVFLGDLITWVNCR